MKNSGNSAPAAAAPASVRVSELDFGLGDLGSSKPAAASANVRVSELDFGLGDLGSGGGAKPAAAADVRVSNLDFGLDDLLGPSGGGGGGGGGDDDDLDALMASLSTAPQPAAAPSANDVLMEIEAAASGAGTSSGGGGGGGGGGDDLDSLLSNLEDQMGDVSADNIGGRSNCAKCKKEVLGEVLQALGRSWHPSCFVCGTCNKYLGTEDFFEQNGVPHCTPCFQKSFAPKCQHCGLPVEGQCLTAMGGKWHPNCFKCTQCKNGFPDGNFFERDNRPYCQNCFHDVAGTKCGACGKVIVGDCVNAMGQGWHPECFVCSYCQCAFTGGQFFEKGGKPYCEQHYHQQAGAICAGCGKPVVGRSVTGPNSQLYHPDHFVCTFCMSPLAGGNYSEEKGKAYCKACHSRLFS